ncbi:MAG: hypothetical protein RL518_1483 [Pseudomonadota bacterium]|jgi:hypothetical protein
MVDQLEPVPVAIDGDAVAFYLEVPRSHVVLLTVFFELYDGVGTVRTLDKDGAVVGVLTTPSQVQDCIGVLKAIREHVSWVPCSEPPTEAS